MRVGGFALAAGCAAVVALAGCGGSSGGISTTDSDLSDVSVPPATTSAPASTSTSGMSAAVKAATAAPRLNERFKKRIQANVAAHGAPEDSDSTCAARKLKYGTTADAADDYNNQVANQLHILCPHYFVPLDKAGAPEPKSERVEPHGAMYDLAKQSCSVFSPSEVAKEYGGDPSDPASVAKAYAKQTAQPAVRSDARAGCLAGFKGR